MRYRALAALIALPALAAGCGGAGVTTGSKPHRKPPSNVIRVACPKGDRRKPVSRAHGADTALVPGHPRVALLCRYSGLNGHPRFALISQRKVTNSATVARLTRELNALPRPPSGAMNCPADFGTAVVAFFGYSSGPVAPVTVGLSGCGEVSNGHVKRLAISVRSRVATQLDALTRP